MTRDEFIEAALKFADRLSQLIDKYADEGNPIRTNALDAWESMTEHMGNPDELTISVFADMAETWNHADELDEQTIIDMVNGKQVQNRVQTLLQERLKPAEGKQDKKSPVEVSDNGSEAAPAAGKLLKFFADVEYKDPEFLIFPYIPEGKITIVQGDPDAGKTAFCCSLAAAVSIGGDICGHKAKQGNVIMISTEDETSTLRGRIEANGGDISKCAFPVDPQDPTGETMLTDLTYTDETIEKLVKAAQAKLIIFDPSQAFFGADVDMFRANQTRPIMASLANMAQRNGCAVVIVSHLNKNTKGRAITRGQGSMDIIGASRSALHIGRNPDDEDERLMFHIKSNNARRGEALSYQIGERGKVTWNGRTALTVDDLDRNSTKKQVEDNIPHESRPVVETYRALLAENPSGFKIPYEDFRTYPVEVLQRPYFATTTGGKGVKAAIDEIAAGAAKQDGIQIYTKKDRPAAYMRGGKPCSVVGNSTPCVIVKPLAPLTAFQTNLQTE